MTSADGIVIRLADPGAPDLRALIEANLNHGAGAAPAESDHTFGVEQLQGADIRFWALFDNGTPLGCGALKQLSDGSAEVKSVYVAAAARGRGLARKIMQHLESEARSSGVTALVLETGSDLLPDYDAARALYEKLGYAYCAPFQGYTADPNSAFMRLAL